MTDKQKIDKILSLLTDKNVFILENLKMIKGKKEQFGALVFATYAFNKAYKIANS